MYARRKKWPLEGIEVELSHRKDYAQDCERCDENESRIDVVDIKIKLFGPLDDDQHTRLQDIAHRCPVSQTLGKGMQIVHREERAHP